MLEGLEKQAQSEARIELEDQNQHERRKTLLAKLEKPEKSIEADRTENICERSQIVDIKRYSLYTIFRNDLSLKAYEIKNSQMISTTDKEERLQMCKMFEEEFNNDPDWIDRQCLVLRRGRFLFGDQYKLSKL